ncbi:MAG: helix-turn-helix transcriptional regulator [Patescibacteria group bacterium]|jgi:transcriptional regulator with XRE-family HTH domain
MNSINTTLGSFIRNSREKQDLSLRELAKKIDCSAAFLSDVELNRRFPTDGMLIRIAEALKIPISKLKENDTRPPVEDIRKKSQLDPNYAFMLRKLNDSGITPNEFLNLIEQSEKKKKKKK